MAVTIVDAVAARSWTAGNGFALSTTTKKFGASSGAFLNAGTSQLFHGATAALDFGTGDFSIRGWVQTGSFAAVQSVVSCMNPLTQSNNAFFIIANGADAGKFGLQGFSSFTRAWFLKSTLTMTANTLQYLELSKVSNTLYLFLDGSAAGSVADTNSWNFNRDQGAGGTYIGTDGVGNTLNGYVDELIMEKGAGHGGHTSSYTAPLTAHSAGSQTVSLLRFNGDATDSSLTAPSSGGGHIVQRTAICMGLR